MEVDKTYLWENQTESFSFLYLIHEIPIKEINSCLMELFMYCWKKPTHVNACNPSNTLRFQRRCLFVLPSHCPHVTSTTSKALGCPLYVRIALFYPLQINMVYRLDKSHQFNRNRRHSQLICLFTCSRLIIY